jgi:membrane fusion protein (multidrug efflux system)
VTLDERIGDLYIVTAGLKRGDRVIVEGLQKVRPGMQVKPELKSATTAPTAPASPPAAKPKAGG